MKKEDWISPAFQKYVSMVAVQDLLKRVRKPDILLLRPLWAPLGVLSGTEELFVFITPQHESVYVVGGVFQAILIQHPGALGKAHTRQPVVLCYEGRYPNIYVSFKVASMVGKKAEYVHNKGLDENICRQLILEALKNAPTTQHELLEVLDVGALPGHLSTEQKSRKLSNILQKMKKEGLVKPTGSRRYAVWSLV